MSEIICPYCDADCGVPDEHGGEGDLEDRECHKCGKRFKYYCEYTIDYSSVKTPCLNGESEHKWTEMIGAPKEFFEGRFRCDYCGEEKKESESNDNRG